MRNDLMSLVHGEVLNDALELSFAELCRSCRISAETMLELVNEGIVTPIGRTQSRWRFRATALRRVWCVMRLQRDLQVNLAGAALVLDLLEEIERLRAQLRE